MTCTGALGTGVPAALYHISCSLDLEWHSDELQNTRPRDTDHPGRWKPRAQGWLSNTAWRLTPPEKVTVFSTEVKAAQGSLGLSGNQGWKHLCVLL